jgi:hypothetical protein
MTKSKAQNEFKIPIFKTAVLSFDIGALDLF